MSYDEVEIEDMQWSEDLQAYTYQCPCGDLFQITLVRLHLHCCSARAVEPGGCTPESLCKGPLSERA
jgi:hypothetical protein